MTLNKNLIIAIVIGVVLLTGAGYLLFFSSPLPAVTETQPTSPEELTFVNLTSQLEPLGFDTSILADPRFMALVDIHTAVVPESAGRRDPFAPIGR